VSSSLVAAIANSTSPIFVFTGGAIVTIPELLPSTVEISFAVDGKLTAPAIPETVGIAAEAVTAIDGTSTVEVGACSPGYKELDGYTELEG